MYIFLLQTGRIQRPFAPSGSPLWEAVDLDYMGAAEFEFGAPQCSLKAMQAAELGYMKFPDIRQNNGGELIGYGSLATEMQEYAVAIKAVANGTARTKERTNMPDAMQPDRFPHYVKTEKDRLAHLARLTSFWWDIQHHVMLSFDAALMEELPKILAKSWLEMGLTK